MADGRILHRSAGDSAKVSALSDLEYRVWTQYLLSADDYGVMPALAVKLQADNRALRNRPVKRVQAALDAVISLGLLSTFEHQGLKYVYQPDWKDWQPIRHERRSVHPRPPKNCGNISEEVPTPAGAGGREVLLPIQTPIPSQVLVQTPPSNSAEPVWAHRGRTASLVGNHRGCFTGQGAPAACARGVCIPNWVGQQWTQQYGEDRGRAEREIADFIGGTLEGLPASGPIGDLGKDFWPAAWKAFHGSQAPKSSLTRTGDTIDAGKRYLAKRFAALRAEEGGSHVAGALKG